LWTTLSRSGLSWPGKHKRRWAGTGSFVLVPREFDCLDAGWGAALAQVVGRLPPRGADLFQALVHLAEVSLVLGETLIRKTHDLLPSPLDANGDGHSESNCEPLAAATPRWSESRRAGGARRTEW
jgi:hypothetical protein